MSQNTKLRIHSKPNNSKNYSHGPLIQELATCAQKISELCNIHREKEEELNSTLVGSIMEVALMYLRTKSTYIYPIPKPHLKTLECFIPSQHLLKIQHLSI